MLPSCWIFTTCACANCFTCFIPFNIHSSGLRWLWPALSVSISLACPPAAEDSKSNALSHNLSCSERIVLVKETQRKICQGDPGKTFPLSWRERVIFGGVSIPHSPARSHCFQLETWTWKCENELSEAGVGKSRKAQRTCKPPIRKLLGQPENCSCLYGLSQG